MAMPIIGDLLPIANRGGGDFNHDSGNGWGCDKDKSQSWDKSRGHKGHGKSHKKDC